MRGRGPSHDPLLLREHPLTEQPCVVHPTGCFGLGTERVVILQRKSSPDG